MAILHVGDTLRSNIVTAVRDTLDSGAGSATMEIYSGTIPATVATAPSGTLLATVSLTDPSIASITNGVGTGGDPASINASATGAAGWARFKDSNGNAHMDGDVTATGGGGTVTLSTVSLTAGYAVDVTSITVTMPAS